MLKDGSHQVEGFDFFIGGGLGPGAAFARRVGYRAPADDVADALERLFNAYVVDRLRGETLRAWSTRRGNAAVKLALETLIDGDQRSDRMRATAS
jgi:sulfite reductase beta subunit-like hemoprotein